MWKSVHPIVLVAAAAASPAVAGSPLTLERSEVVSYADLNLNSKAGLDQFDRRIANAVRRVCGRASPGSLEESQDLRRCRAAALTRISGLREAAIAAANQGDAGIRVAAVLD